MVQNRVIEIWTRFSYKLDITREHCSLMEGVVRERSCMLAGHAEDNRVLDDNRVICEAISVHDTALAAVTIKPHNRTIALDHDRDRLEEGCQPGFNVGSLSSMCPNTSSNAPKPRRTDRPEPSYLRILN